ncbi:MAG TPA: hypothetical protein VMG98_15155 [Verrucomicrobiae bacterium]|nr:hypothetical protein [Verrucomicrobiae bacterium]
MRLWSAVLLAIAAAAIAPQTAMTVCAVTASVLLESLPYLTLAAVLSILAGRHARVLVAYAGCGCTEGPSARSIPAAIATAAMFGAPAALARVTAAILVSRFVGRHDHDRRTSVLGELVALVPAAVLSAAIMLLLPSLPLRGLPTPFLIVCGALLGVVSSPCAFGGVALAAALHASAPWCAAGVLCTGGIVPSLWRRHIHEVPHDPWAYGALGLACALVAARHGGTLVHPRMTIPLTLTAIVFLVFAWRFRAHRARAARWLAFAALAATIIGAPAPTYHVTETTLADGFAGERVDFTGVAVSERGHSALVRYAITCCRADAAPVALALDRNLTNANGHWLRAHGMLERDGMQLQLHVDVLTPIAPPADPFIYR